MEDSYGTLSNGNRVDPGLQIIRHPSYQLCNKSLLPWFDIRVFYVRISNFLVDVVTPECLTLNHIPLNPDTLLEVNGTRCSIDSKGVTCLLRRDRVDKKCEEATFVSTDSTRLTGSVKFEVFDKDDIVLSGVLELFNSNGLTVESKHIAGKWRINCESATSTGTGFFKGKQIIGSESLTPIVEVYVAGCFSGTPIILTKSLQLSFRKKQNRKGMLGSIPECDATESHKEVRSLLHLQVAERSNYKSKSDEDYNMYWRRTEYMEYDDGELSWFNAGVRVGVGIGLGICLGIGVGVGLLVRTYQATTRNFKRPLA